MPTKLIEARPRSPQVLEVGRVVVGLAGVAVVGDAVEGHADRTHGAGAVAGLQRVDPRAADDDVARAGIVVVGREPVVAGAAVEQVRAGLALERVVAVLAVELDAVAGGVVVDRRRVVVAVAEQDHEARVRAGVDAARAEASSVHGGIAVSRRCRRATGM